MTTKVAFFSYALNVLTFLIIFVCMSIRNGREVAMKMEVPFQIFPYIFNVDFMIRIVMMVFWGIASGIYYLLKHTMIFSGILHLSVGIAAVTLVIATYVKHDTWIVLLAHAVLIVQWYFAITWVRTHALW